MTENQTPKEILTQHKDDLIVIVQELLSNCLSSDKLEEYNSLMWQIKSIKASIVCQGMDDFSVFWVWVCVGFVAIVLSPKPNPSYFPFHILSPTLSRTTGKQPDRQRMFYSLALYPS